MSKMKFLLMTKDGAQEKEINYDQVFAIGYAGRNMEKTMEHIRELEEQLRSSGPEENSDDISVRHVSADPGKRPAFYRGKDLRGSGICDGGDRRKAFYIGLGSDHTDRELEGMSVLKAKQICAKPIGTILWDYEEIKEHWETIKPYSYQTVDGGGDSLSAGNSGRHHGSGMILKELDERVGNVTDAVIYSGTVPLTEGFRYGDRIQMRDGRRGVGKKVIIKLQGDYSQ